MPALPTPPSISASGQAFWKRNALENTSNRAWLIVAAVAALLALGACIAVVAVSISKRRLVQRQLEEARQRDPCLEPKEFSRRRRMTREDLVLEAEGQREAMIRKSLASRSGRSTSMSSSQTFDQMSIAERSGQHDFAEGYGLYDDKSWEDQLSRPISLSSLQRARSISPFPEPPAPTHSRSPSPDTLPRAVVDRSGLPPFLAQHPLFQRPQIGDDDLEDEHVGPSLMKPAIQSKEE